MVIVSGWLVIPLDHGVHVLPNGQRTRHELDRGCRCGPRVEMQNPETGEAFRVPVVQHHEIVLA